MINHLLFTVYVIMRYDLIVILRGDWPKHDLRSSLIIKTLNLKNRDCSNNYFLIIYLFTVLKNHKNKPIFPISLIEISLLRPLLLYSIFTSCVKE